MIRMRPSSDFQSRMILASAVERIWTEKRAEMRRPVWLYGHISLTGVAEPIESTVRDISEGGCRIELANADDLPAKFDIRIEGHNSSRACNIVWRSGDQVGLKFL